MVIKTDYLSVENIFILTGIDEHSLLKAVDAAVIMQRNDNFVISVLDYIEENVSDKIVKIIQSYTGVCQ